MRPSDRRVEGKLAREYRGPPWRATGTEVPRAPEKKCAPATDRRARTKRREKIISAGAKARERQKKYFLGGSEKRGAVAKKNNILTPARTQHNPQNDCVMYCRDQ